MDPLSKWFLVAQPEGSVDKVCHVDGEWQLPHSTGESSVIRWHVVLSGTVCVESPSSFQTILTAPSLILIPQNTAHRLSHKGKDGAFIVCGSINFCSTAREIFTVLPEVLIMTPEPDSVERKWLIEATQLLLKRGNAEQPGDDAILSQQCSSLLMLCLQYWLNNRKSDVDQGIFNALLHPLVGTVILKMIEYPAVSWSVERLANELHMSRTRFAILFRNETGTTPVAVLTGIRMRIAAQRLAQDNTPIIKISQYVGYANESSFNKAFVRYFGCSPGKYRKNAMELQGEE